MSKVNQKKQQSQVKYEPKPQEAVELESFDNRCARAKCIQTLEKKDGEVRVKHQDEVTGALLLMESLASANPYFTNGILNQILKLTSQDDNLTDANFTLSLVYGIEPRDPLETMLATQMAAIHNATMTMAKRLSCADNLDKQDAAERALNKLARTFTTQMDALKRYRSTGETKLTVQHINVEDGGQAIVGNVSGTGGTFKNEEKPHAKPKQITNAPVETLSCALETNRETVPSSSR
ncbi:MAG: hypothetical protein PHY54_11105 [Methylococcales bacterium]|nr:hypothetical protein [Methylococcales bacterium]